jgi:pyruvate/2-oxoglutarate dehydrogenase complex dihydrolipoamide acyltransferase (E2) component
MTDPVTPVVDEEAQAIQEAKAGYEGKTRAQAPVEPVVEEEAAQPLTEPTPAASTPDPEDEPDAQAEATDAATQPDPTATIKQQLDDLKAQVKEMAATGADVRKMHGDIGEINRTLKQLKALEKADAPAVDELAAAMKEAEEQAAEYPEIAGPLLKALKALEARIPQQPSADKDDNEPVDPPDPTLAVRIAREQAAIDALNEVHPDRIEIKESPQFKKWFAAWKTPEYRTKVTSSWNPAVVAEPFTDYKAWLAAQKRKQERIEAAVTEKGVPAGGPTAISDEEAARIGYERARGKRL